MVVGQRVNVIFIDGQVSAVKPGEVAHIHTYADGHVHVSICLSGGELVHAEAETPGEPVQASVVS